MDDGRHERVVDNSHPLSVRRKLSEKSSDWFAEMAGGFEERLEMTREFGGVLVGIRKRGRERRDREVVEMDTGEGRWVAAVDSEHGLAVVSGGADEMDGNVVG